MGDKISVSELVKLYVDGGRNFRNADLSGVDLKGVNLQEADLQGAYLRWAELQGANLKQASLAWADLQRANLSDAILIKANLKEATLRGACLQWADFAEADLQGATLIKSDLVCANFRGASLRLAKLEGANLDKVNLNGADLRVATFQEAHLLDADLQNAKLQGAILSRANLTGANLEGASLQGADFQEAILIGTNFTEANLQQANLEKAQLHDAKLFRANLEGANLQGARLPSIENMEGACLRGANLQGIELPRGQNLHKVMLPNGMISENHNPSPMQSVPMNGQATAEYRDRTMLSMKAPIPDKGGKQTALEAKQEVSRTTEQYAQSAGKRGSVSAEEARDRDKRSQSDSIEAAIADEKLQDTPNISNHHAPQPIETGMVTQFPLDSAQKRIDGDGFLNRASIAIAHRRGPSEFRQNLMAAYNGCCVITGCDAEPVLEAVYLLPHGTGDPNHPSAGLLLRADLHTLFDLHLIAIDPDTLNVLVAPSLRDTSYGELHGQPLRAAIAAEFRPSTEGLQFHWNWCRWAQK